MDEPIRIHLEIEIDALAEPVVGSLTPRGGEVEPFTGWIELATALERARCDARERVARPVEAGRES